MPNATTSGWMSPPSGERSFTSGSLHTAMGRDRARLRVHIPATSPLYTHNPPLGLTPILPNTHSELAAKARPVRMEAARARLLRNCTPMRTMGPTAPSMARRVSAMGREPRMRSAAARLASRSVVGLDIPDHVRHTANTRELPVIITTHTSSVTPVVTYVINPGGGRGPAGVTGSEVRSDAEVRSEVTILVYNSLCVRPFSSSDERCYTF